jgi:hypothetical protein
MQGREILVAHEAQIAPVTHMRSTLVQMSLAGLRERGHFELWRERLEPAVRAEILESVGPQWLTVDLAFAHYTACDSLGLAQQEIEALGGMAGERMRNTFLGNILRMGNQIGITPFTPVPHVARAWPRGFQGGSLQVAKLGPKDCEFEVRGLSLGRIPYFREAYVGLLREAVRLFGARKSYAKVTRHLSDNFAIMVSWV